MTELPFVPTTEQVRDDYVLVNTRNFDAYQVGRSLASEQEHYGAGFDAWLAAHDAEVRADERAKRPDREQMRQLVYQALDPFHVYGAEFSIGDTDEVADAVLSSLALEPETREVTDAECGRCGKFAEVHREGWFYDHGNPEACPGSGERPADTHVE